MKKLFSRGTKKKKEEEKKNNNKKLDFNPTGHDDKSDDDDPIVVIYDDYDDDVNIDFVRAMRGSATSSKQQCGGCHCMKKESNDNNKKENNEMNKKEYEYMSVSNGIQFAFEPADMPNAPAPDVIWLNEKGSQGWELVAVIDNPIKGTRRYYLKREK